jgi:allophanate hydrolase
MSHLASLRAAYAGGRSPRDVIAGVLARIGAAGDDRVWIARVPDAALHDRAAMLAELPLEERTRLPLYGVPFAVKDNIDLASVPTTAACPEFAYTPVRSAAAVERLEAAGAIAIGKTNLDQFATGLVGTRSPYGVPRNPFDARFVPGGSSSGSAVAVAVGQVAFALGTDTAGSGRVPAAFNNIVGLKPTRGLVSTRGVVAACRSLDCVSVFALTAADAWEVLRVAAAPDAADSYSRAATLGEAWRPARFRFAVPRAPEFFGDDAAQAIFVAARERLAALGGSAVAIDFAPFAEAAALLYEGPWVAERLHAIRDFIAAHPDALHPVTRAIVAGGARLSAVDAFDGLYRLEAVRARTRALWNDVDVLLVPTAPTIYTVAQIAAEPVALNARLGTYTNFVNLLDLAAIAVPQGFDARGLPHGATLIAPAFAEPLLIGLGEALHRAAGVTLGATDMAMPDPPARPEIAPDAIALFVVGAHLSGEPLNHQLTSIGARLLRACTTAPSYRLYALPGTPARPGMVRAESNAHGAAIAGEVWAVPAAALGGFVARIPSPLGVGRVALDDGSDVLGFLCEAAALDGAAEITRFGGWRAWRAQQATSSAAT